MFPGPQELILILLIVVMVFGAKRIPEIMGGLGKGIREFKRSVDTDEPAPTQAPKAEGNQASTGTATPGRIETK